MSTQVNLGRKSRFLNTAMVLHSFSNSNCIVDYMDFFQTILITVM